MNPDELNPRNDEQGDMPEDPMPGLIAGLDQLLANAPHITRVAFGFFEQYEAAGFNTDQALYLAACQVHGGPGVPPT